jgi:hypothetical protein
MSTGGRVNAFKTLQVVAPKVPYTGTGFVVGGAPGRVQIRRLGDSALVADFAPFGNAYTGGVSVAMGDINKDGYRDIVVAAASGNPHVKIYDGWLLSTGYSASNPEAALMTQLFPFSLQFNVGANVALGDVDGDGWSDVIAGATAGNPHVKLFSGKYLSFGYAENSLVRELFAYGLQFNVGAHVAAGDFDKDGYAEIVTGATAGNPHVKVFDGESFAFGSSLAIMDEFFAYGLQFNVGVFVTSGDTNGDFVPDIITGAGIGNPHVKVYDGRAVAAGAVPMTNNSWAVFSQFFAFAEIQNIGARVGVVDYNFDGRVEILTGAAKTYPWFRVVQGNATGVQPPALFEEYSLVFSAGVFVGG